MPRVSVNGVLRDLACPEDEPLAYVLRNRLGLPGTRLACGLEQCGACVVMVDGHCRHACSLPVGACDGASVTTVEGVGREDALHAVQQALLDHNAGQCGYCLSGIVMRAVALFAEDQRPSPSAIREALSGHLCRCGAHPRVLRALDALAAAT